MHNFRHVLGKLYHHMVVGTGGFATGITFCYWGWHVKGSCKDTVLVTAFITRSPSLQVEVAELYTKSAANLLLPQQKTTTASLSSFLCSNFIWIFGTPWMSITSSRCWAWRSKEYTLQLLHGQGLNIAKCCTFLSSRRFQEHSSQKLPFGSIQPHYQLKTSKNILSLSTPPAFKPPVPCHFDTWVAVAFFWAAELLA